ncbi:MAG: hypothetical protein ACT4P7_21445 [Gemmatimonadaceae bacterium]
MSLRCALALSLCLASGWSCKDDPQSPPAQVPGTATAPVLLSTGSPTKDEDPSVLRARDGTLFVAWFSDRGGNSGDIYVSRSSDKNTWAAPVRVTTGPAGDFYPNLLQDASGLFHLVWFQWIALAVGQIRHSTSVDGTAWTAESAVTTQSGVDDWVPTVCQAPDGSLLVYFVSEKRDLTNPTSDIFVARKRPGAVAWDAAVRVAGVSSATEHDHLPFVARVGDRVVLVWVRYDTRDPDFITNPKSDLYYSTSADGLSWAAPAQVTREVGNAANLFPQLYQRHDGAWAILWLSTRGGTPRQYELSLSRVSEYPAATAENALLPAGYSHRMAATSTGGEYLAAWVQGPRGSEDIYYRYIRRD